MPRNDELDEARKMIAALRSEQTRMRAELRASEQRSAQQTARTLSDARQQAEADTVVLRSDLTAARAESERHRAEAENLRLELQHARSHAQDLALRKTDEDAVLSNLQAEHQALQRQHAELVGRRSSSIGDVDVLRSERDRAQADAIGLNNALREATERYDSLANAHRRATQQLDTVGTVGTDPMAEAELVAARATIRSLQSKLNTAESKYATLRPEYDKAVDHVQILNRAALDNATAVAQLKAQVQTAARQRDAFHQSHAATLEAENERLRAESELVRKRDERTGDAVRRDAALWRAYQQRKTALDYGDDDSESDDDFVPPPEPRPVVVAVAKATVVKPAPAPAAPPDEDEEVYVCEWADCGFEAPHRGALISHAVAKHA